MPSHAARVKSMVDEVVSPSVWLVITMGASVMERVSAPTCPWTMPLLYVIVKDASEPCRNKVLFSNSRYYCDKQGTRPSLPLDCPPLLCDNERRI